MNETLRLRRCPRSRRAATMLALLVCLLALPAAAQTQAALVERQYQLRFLAFGDGITIATNLCMNDRCAVSNAGPSTLRVTADLATHERIAKALREADLPPADQAFQLILLQADRSGSGDPGPLPAGARKALTDLADFLPYTRYRLLDSAFVRTNREARMVVEGMGGHSYEAHLRFRGDARAPGAELLVDRFLLRLIPGDVLGLLMANARAGGTAPGAAPPAPGNSSARPPGASAPNPPPGGPTTTGERAGTGAPAQPAAAPTPPTPGATLAETLLDTTFSLRRGETVVVGTSKLNGGDSALVVLLTALP